MTLRQGTYCQNYFISESIIPEISRPRLSRNTLFFLISLFALIIINPSFATGTKNLIPRVPEFVIEKGFSDSFQVVECVANTQIANEEAESFVKIILKNISDKTIDTALKVRILYLSGDRAAQITVDGKPKNFDRKNPRIVLSLSPGQETELQVKAKHGIQYNLDAAKKEKPDFRPEPETKKWGFSMGNLARFFERENFGRRFMVGPLVSKWGIFPVEFKHIRVEITVPGDFAGIFPNQEGMNAWQKKEKNNGTTFSFEGTEGFSGVLFLPKKDLNSDTSPAPANLAPQGITVSSHPADPL